MTAIGGLGSVGLLGAGVIGGGWAARFLLNGVDVKVFDPDPDAPRKLEEVVSNAAPVAASAVVGSTARRGPADVRRHP